jgi:hypothetical protein
MTINSIHLLLSSERFIYNANTFNKLWLCLKNTHNLRYSLRHDKKQVFTAIFTCWKLKGKSSITHSNHFFDKAWSRMKRNQLRATFGRSKDEIDAYLRVLLVLSMVCTIRSKALIQLFLLSFIRLSRVAQFCGNDEITCDRMWAWLFVRQLIWVIR